LNNNLAPLKNSFKKNESLSLISNNSSDKEGESKENPSSDNAIGKENEYSIIEIGGRKIPGVIANWKEEV